MCFMKNKPLILLTNDDGFEAKGINALLKILLPLADVVMMAPDSGRSGAACSITSSVPVSFYQVSEVEGCVVYKCTGSPVDCVKLALEQVVPRKPDMVVSGINHGDNASVSVVYSGTMGAVLEGCMKGIPSVGFSAYSTRQDFDFAPFAPHIRGIVERVLNEGLPKGVSLNVNIPDTADVQGVKVCRMAHGNWSAEWVCAASPKCKNTYWLTGEFTNMEPDSEDTDFWALDHGFVSVVPTHVDLTAHWAMEQLKDLEQL